MQTRADIETEAASIRTPDQRLRVFVSSTLEELADERRAVRDAIESLHLTPVMFELGARPHAPRALYRAYLEQSDVFVGVYWERYGWVAPGEQISGLEDEYRLSGDRPKLIYIKAPAPNREPGLSALIESIQADDRASYRRFADPHELASLIVEDLAVMLTERFSASAGSRFGSPRSRASSLPRPATRLIGREKDVRAVIDLLADPDIRIVTILGAGGIGKSRLALAVGEAAKDRYADGIAYVELASVTEPSLLVPAIARALGLQEQRGTALATGVRERLGDARMLIVLDNMEQLTGAARAVSDLVAGTSLLQVLVTSRRILNIRGERVFALEPLGVPGTDGAMTPAVELFLERARAIRPGYEPTEADLAAIAEICRRLDGLPLALELASARVRVLAPPALLERMGRHRLQFLRGGASDLPPRQRTLRDAIAWSHSLLPEESQLLFARLGVFVGGADLHAIERVTDPDGMLSTIDLLADLVDGSLVRALGPAAEPRFAMLETIREFAVERLEETAEAAEYRGRHESYFLELAARGNAALGTAEQVAWLDRLGREDDNFRAVFRRAIRRGDAPTAVRLGRSLAAYWHMRGSYTEGRGWMQQAAGLPGAGSRERAVAWTIGAVQAFLQGDFEPLETGLDDRLALLDADEDGQVAAYAQMLRAIATGAERDAERWRRALNEASRRLEASGVPLAVGFGLLASAHLALADGRAMEAKELGQAALESSARIGESYVRTFASTQLARATVELGDWPAAERHAEQALLGARRLGNVHAASYALELWSAAELGVGRAERAGRLFALAERGYRQVGSGPWRSDAGWRRKLTTDLRTALGGRYDVFLADAADASGVDFDQAVAELTNG